MILSLEELCYRTLDLPNHKKRLKEIKLELKEHCSKRNLCFVHNELLNLFVLSEIIWIPRGKCSEFPKWERSLIINDKEITIPLAKSYSYNMDLWSCSPPQEEWDCVEAQMF